MLHGLDSADTYIQHIQPLTKNELDGTKEDTQQASIVCTTEPSTPTLSSPTEPNIGNSGGVTGLILSLAVLIRSTAILIQVLAPIVRKSGK